MKMGEIEETFNEIVTTISNYWTNYPYDEGLDQHDNFVDFPLWKREFETFTRPLVENGINEVMESLVSASQVRGEGIELAIQRYGLRTTQEEDQEAGPSTSRACPEPEPKKRKTEPNLEEVLISAVGSAISDIGLMKVQHR